MADQIQELLDVPREFLKDGIQFINRAQKRTSPNPASCVLFSAASALHLASRMVLR